MPARSERPYAHGADGQQPSQRDAAADWPDARARISIELRPRSLSAAIWSGSRKLRLWPELFRPQASRRRHQQRAPQVAPSKEAVVSTRTAEESKTQLSSLALRWFTPINTRDNQGGTLLSSSSAARLTLQAAGEPLTADVRHSTENADPRGKGLGAESGSSVEWTTKPRNDQSPKVAPPTAVPRSSAALAFRLKTLISGAL